ncbi:hypothetical protein D5086_016045 [Populus alba]|uniref:Uncharacterized protein n=1 Tax=Populus alba TaxID=43335 RepID=A0ACC4BSX3_POPAL
MRCCPNQQCQLLLTVLSTGGHSKFYEVDNYTLKPLKIIERNIANSKLCYIILSTMALLWELSPHLWFSKPQEDKTQ